MMSENNDDLEKLTDEIADLACSIKLGTIKLNNLKLDLLKKMHGSRLKNVKTIKAKITRYEKNKDITPFSNKLKTGIMQFAESNPEKIEKLIKKGIVKRISNYELDPKAYYDISNSGSDNTSIDTDTTDIEDYVILNKYRNYLYVFLNSEWSIEIKDKQNSFEDRNLTVQNFLQKEAEEQKFSHEKKSLVEEEADSGDGIESELEEETEDVYLKAEESIWDLDPGVAQYSDDPDEEISETEREELGLPRDYL